MPKQKWFIKSTQKAIALIEEAKSIMSDNRDDQDDRLNRFAPNAVNSPNYQLAEERLDKLNEMGITV